jgi:hypothetical protein
MVTGRVYKEMIWYGWLGAIVLLVDQALLPWQIDALARWFTPAMWTGYILLVDAVVLRRDGRSLLHDRPREALYMATVSVPLWLLFEAYNVRLRNWAYFGVPETPWVAAIAYAWAFATIWPGLFETAALLGAGPLPTPAAPPMRIPPTLGLRLAMAIGGVFVIVPPLLPAAVRPWTFGFVWLGFVLLLDPSNALAGRPSFLAAWRGGRRGFVWRWLLAGVVCGLLWEFWNYWALAKWRYVGVPVFPSVKLFEMPVAGYLGFPPFALEVFAMYHFVRPLAGLSEPKDSDGRTIDRPPTRATRGGR